MRSLMRGTIAALVLGLAALVFAPRPAPSATPPRAPSRTAIAPVSTAPAVAGVPTSATDDAVPTPPVAADCVVETAARLRSKDDLLGFNNDRYGVTFAPDGVMVAPSHDDVSRLHLRLDAIRCGERVIAAGDAVAPRGDGDAAVAYDRGDVEERWLLRDADLEQLFVIHRLPERAALTVRIAVATDLPAPADGTRAPSLSYGGVFTVSDALILDAVGRELPATLLADGLSYVIEVPADWVAAATLPITVDPTVGAAITVDSAVNGFDERGVDVAYSATSNEWLVVWNERFGASTFDYDVFGQRVSSTGALVGSPILIDFTAQSSRECAVAWASSGNQYLVVWGHDPADNSSSDDRTIRGRRVLASGSLAASSFLVHDASLADWRPDVAWGPGLSQWAVVHDNQSNILGRFVSTAEALGTPFTIDGDPDFAARAAVAYNTASSTFVAAWHKGTLPDQSIAARRFSTTGAFGSIALVDENSGTNSYPDVVEGGTNWLIVWHYEFSATDFDIYARRMSITGAFVGSSIAVDTGLSRSERPEVGYSSASSEWLVAYQDNATGAGDIYGRRVTSAGALVAGGPYFIGSAPGLERNPCLPPQQNSANEFLVAHMGGSASPYTVNARRFSLDYTGPPAPTPTSPGGPTSDNTPTLSWTAVSDPAGIANYQYEFDDSSLFTAPIAAGGTILVTTTTFGPMADGIWYWRVRATDALGNVGAWSVTTSITIDTAAPAAPALVAPANLSTTADGTPTFDWLAVTDPAGVAYELMVDNSGSGFPSPEISVSGLTVTDYTPGAALADGTYSWRVRAIDGAGNAGAWSAVWSVTISTTPPAIGLSPSTLAFTAPPVPAPATVTVTNIGGGVLAWSATDDASWLSLAPASGSLTAGAAAPMTVTPDATGLAPGVYLATITVTAPGAAPATVAVSLTVSATPAIGLSPSTLAFTAPPSPVSSVVTVTNTGGGTLAWSATDDASWLSLAPASGSLAAGASAPMTATVDATGLAAGPYTATITVTAPGTAPATVAVSLTVSATPAIGLSPSTLSFAAPAGGPSPAPATVIVSNTGGGTLAWTASDDASWLSLAPTSGSLAAGASAPMSVIVDATGLAAGPYSATITVTAPGASPATVAVSLTVSAAPAIGLSPSTLSFTAPVGGPGPAPATVAVSNTGGGTLAWSAADDASWLSLAPASGSLAAGAAAPMSVIVDVTGLAAGPYSATITVTAPGATPAAVAVSLTVTDLPTIGLSASTLAFSAPLGGPNPASQLLTLSNTGGGVLSWSAASSAGWLSVSPASGTLASAASTLLVVLVDVTGLAAGPYAGTLTFTAPGATNSPQSVAVTLNVNDLPTIGLSPSTLSFAAPAGGPNPPSQAVAVSNVGTGTLDWTLGPLPSWLSATPLSGSLAAGASVPVDFTADVTGLAAGVYTASIPVTSASATNSPQTVFVTLTVGGASAGAPAGTDKRSREHRLCQFSASSEGSIMAWAGMLAALALALCRRR